MPRASTRCGPRCPPTPTGECIDTRHRKKHTSRALRPRGSEARASVRHARRAPRRLRRSLLQYSRSEGWSLEEGIVKSGSFNIEQGVGVRAVSGEKTAFAYSDEISFDALTDAAKATRAIGNMGQSKIVKSNQGKAPVPLYRAIDPIASLASEQKVSL